MLTLLVPSVFFVHALLPPSHFSAPLNLQNPDARFHFLKPAHLKKINAIERQLKSSLDQLTDDPTGLDRFSGEGVVLFEDLPETLFPKKPFHRELLQKSGEIFSSPLKWQKNDWLAAGLLLPAFRILASADQPVADYSRREHTGGSHVVLQKIGGLGEEYSFLVIGGFWLSGKIFKSEKSVNVARDSLTSSIIAAGLITPALKEVFGRQRPNTTDNAFTFQSFGGGHSFPSGHTTQAFAVAGTIARHYDNPWIKWTSYSLAGLVGLSRIEADAHYLTDVVAGAGIGLWVSRKVVKRQDQRERFRWSPYFGAVGVGVSLVFKNR